MREGWSAAGLLRPLWQRYPGKRDGLAASVGTTPSTLSAINTGRRNLGLDLGERLAAALAVSLQELGAPGEPTGGPAGTIADRVRQLERETDELRRLLFETLRLLALEVEHGEGGEPPTVRRFPSQHEQPGQ